MFVFRNFTVENLFKEGTSFSGYGDISIVPSEESELIWLYQAPMTFDVTTKVAEIESMAEKLSLVISQLQSNQCLYVCTLMDMFPVTMVDCDRRVPDAINHFNSVVREIEGSNPKVKVVDISDYFSHFPVSEWVNWRFYFISQMIINPGLSGGFAEWFDRRLQQIKGMRKKCLVLDLDNTLWGGIVGEDGVKGIKIGGEYPGNAFLYFQEALIELSKTGVILTVCSKNNEEDVIEVWEKNPFIRLKKEHFAAMRINWQNKADNIREIASELNIGLESLVFIDDNPTERELIRQQLPMVSVPDFPKKPYGLMDLYRELCEKYFRVHTLTSEDLNKTEQYKANAARIEASRQFADLSEYIRSLDIEIKIMDANDFTIPRIAQMTQKTNQFNLTTHRYTEADIRNFLNKGAYVVCASVADRFGDNGITGAAIVNIDKTTAHIDSFLLSCRILGKGIENAILDALLNNLYGKGISNVTAEYIPTPKNAQVSEFYEHNGFDIIENSDGTKKYSLILMNSRQISDSYSIKNFSHGRENS